MFRTLVSRSVLPPAPRLRAPIPRSKFQEIALFLKAGAICEPAVVNARTCDDYPSMLAGASAKVVGGGIGATLTKIAFVFAHCGN